MLFRSCFTGGLPAPYAGGQVWWANSTQGLNAFFGYKGAGSLTFKTYVTTAIGGGGGGGPNPGASPELDSFVLFGTSLSGLVGFALMRRRPRKL